MPLRASSHPGSPNSPSCSALAWYSCWPGLSPWGESWKRTRVARTAALTRYRYATQPTIRYYYQIKILFYVILASFCRLLHFCYSLIKIIAGRVHVAVHSITHLQLSVSRYHIVTYGHVWCKSCILITWSAYLINYYTVDPSRDM